MKEGDIIITLMPQADGDTKLRPALILREMPLFRDLLVCGISTQVQHKVKNFDEIISPADSDFAKSGLITKSVIRPGFLAVLTRKKIAGAIGSISSKRHKRLLKNLSDYLIQGNEPQKSQNR